MPAANEFGALDMSSNVIAGRSFYAQTGRDDFVFARTEECEPGQLLISTLAAFHAMSSRGVSLCQIERHTPRIACFKYTLLNGMLHLFLALDVTFDVFQTNSLFPTKVESADSYAES
jgi:hypothetical protein